MKRTYRTGSNAKTKRLAVPTAELVNRTHDITISDLFDGFLESRRGLSAETIHFYEEKRPVLFRWLEEQKIIRLNQLTATKLNDFFAFLEERGNNKGGQMGYFRTLKAMMRWWEKETDGEYRPTIYKIVPPTVKIKPIPGVDPEEVEKMMQACHGRYEVRDRALLAVLLDTGLRASEFLSLNLEDVNILNGAVEVHDGKREKDRKVFLGNKTRRLLRAYLSQRANYSGNLHAHSPLFVNDYGKRLVYGTLREIIRRRALDADLGGVPYPHDFRRAFALACWRRGIDLITIGRLMGHSSLEVLKRYLAQNDDDLLRAHAIASPVDALNTRKENGGEKKAAK